MSVSLLKLIASFQNSLASAVSVGATTATLSSALDNDDVAIPSGKYGFTIDGDNSAKEFIVCDVVGTAITNITNISLQGTSTAGFANYHRVGATVTITDWAILSRMLNNLNGTTGFDSGTAIKYDGQPTLTDPTAIPTVQYVLDTASGAPVTFNAQTISAVAGETIADGEWIYYNTTDGEWYKTDADDTTKSLNVQIGKARGAGTNGNAITGGVFISGTETVGSYVAGTTYYLGNTAGALATSAGTNSVVVGVGDANGDLVLNRTTPNQVSASIGGGVQGTPNASNLFVTETGLVQSGVFSMIAGATINGATLPVPVYQDTTSNKVIACDGNDLATLKFIGFAVSNSTDTNPINVRTSGIVGGFTGLDEGVSYWLSDTIGTIQNTPGTYSALVGVAVSSTQLLIQKGRRTFAGEGGSVGTASGSTVVNCGFRPTTVRVHARSAANTFLCVMDLTYTNGAVSAISAFYDDATAILINNEPRLYGNPNTSYMEFSVTSITNTGFTVAWTENGTFSDTGFFMYEAEGEI